MPVPPVARFHLFALVIGILYLAGAAALAYGRPPWCDEAWYGYPAWMLVTAGHMGTPVLEGAGTGLRNIAHYTYWEMPGHILAQAVSYKFFGISVFSTRLLPVLWGGAALAAWYSILVQLTCRSKLALFAIGLLATDYFFVLSAAIGRSDMMSTACGALGLALYLRWREAHLRRALVTANSLVMVCGLTHPNGGMVYFAALIYLVLRFDRKRIRLTDLLLSALPYLAGAAAWGSYIALDVEAFRAQFGGNATGRFGNLLRPWRAVYDEITLRYFVTFGLAGESGWGGIRLLKSYVLLVYIVAASGIALLPALRRDPALRPVYHLAILIGSVLTLLDASKQHYYLLHLIPLLTALVAVFLLWGLEQPGVRRWGAGLLLAGLITVQMGGIAYRSIKDDRHRQFEPAAQYLAANVSPGQTVFGTAAFGFALNWPVWLHDDVRLGFYSGRTPDFFVMEDSYEVVHNALAVENPPLYAFLVKRKTEGYRVRFENALYKIYGRAQ